MENRKYRKAVPLNDCSSIVYACQFREDEFEFVNMPFPQGVKCCLIEIVERHFVLPNDWCVWLPEDIAYFICHDEEFRSKYTLYEDLPPKIRALADRHPAYEEWVEQCNMLADLPLQ